MSVETLESTIEQLTSFAARHCHSSGRRAEPRHVIRSVAFVQPLDADNTPVGEPIVSVTRDMSMSGIGLIAESRPPFNSVAISFAIDEQDVWLLGSLRWCRPMGPFELLGVKLVKRLDSIAERWAEDARRYRAVLSSMPKNEVLHS